jgi:arylsulfatase A-like enzyme
VKERTLTRSDFLKVAGAGAAGATMLGAAGCGPLANSFTQVPEEYLPSGGSRMNVILVIIDSLRRDHLGVYGNDWIKTPNLDALAKESLRFDRSYPESMPTILARRAIHTGIRTFPFRNWQKWYDEDVALWGWQPIPRDQTTLGEILLGEGFYNLMVTDTLHQFRPFYDMHRGFHAFDFIRGQERDYFRPQSPASEKKMENTLVGGPSAGHSAEIMRQYWANTLGRQGEEDWFAPQVFTKAAEYLEMAKESQPFFMLVDNYDPHEPWDPPQKYIDLYSDGFDGPEPVTSSSGPSDWLTEKQLKRMHARYSAEVTMADHWLGHFLDKAQGLGLLDNTMLIVLSDHGHAFGEHGYAGKVAGALYPELTDTIFFIRHPGGKGAGESSDHYASTHDVAPTILGAMGVEPHPQMGGQDLSVVLDGKEPSPRTHFTAGYHDHVVTRDEKYAMFCLYDGSDPHLFDLENDAAMDKNIASSNPDVVKKMFNEYIIKDAGGPLPHY